MSKKYILIGIKVAILAICAVQVLLVYEPTFEVLGPFAFVSDFLHLPKEGIGRLSLVLSLFWLIAVLAAIKNGTKDTFWLWLTLPFGVPLPFKFLMMLAMWPSF